MSLIENIKVSSEFEGLRLDVFLTKALQKYSRSFFQKLIKQGKIKIKNKKISSHYKVENGDLVIIEFPQDNIKTPKEEKIELEIVYQDKDLIIINKSAGIVVHPSEDGQNMEGTIVNALLSKFGKDKLSKIGGDLRPGIVHRLDKDTSGLLIIALNNKSHEYIVDLMKKRKIEKKYIVLVNGKLEHEEGTINAPIARSVKDRKKFDITDEGEGKEAITEFEVIDYYEFDKTNFTLLEVNLITGRTHQIRVHFKSIGYPVAGDNIYGNKKINNMLNKLSLYRQFLHAYKIKFKLPNGKVIEIEKELPLELKEVLGKMHKIQ